MAGYRLYGRRETGSSAIEAALEEARVPCLGLEIGPGTATAQMAEFEALKPRGQVPVLVLPAGTVVTECPAILNHIADAFPQARLAPEPDSSARATHDRWLAFFHANVYEGFLREFYADRYTADPTGAAAVSAAATAHIRAHLIQFDTQLGDGPYLFGARLTVCDIFVWMLCQWTDADWLATACRPVDRLRATASARPALGAVLARHSGPPV